MNNEKSKCSIISQSVFNESDEDYKGWLRRSLSEEATATPNNSRIIVENLIEAVRAREFLWDVGKSQYKDRVHGPKLWKEVARELNYSEENYVDLRKKWGMVKCAYARSKIGAPSGSGCFRKPYKYARLLSFLDDTCQPRAEITTVRTVEPSTPSPSSSEVSSWDSSQLPPRRDVESSALKRRAIEILESREKKQFRSEELFGQFVTAELFQIPEKRRSQLQLKIMQCIVEAKEETTA